jgi:hypothetical protein
MEAGEQLSLLNVPGPEGKPIAAVFTAEKRVTERFGAGTGFVRMKGEALLAGVASTGALLNPGLGYSVHWGPTELAALLGRAVPRTLTEPTQILLGSPKETPERLIADLRRVLGSEHRIAAAWLALANWPEDGVGIRVAPLTH